MLISVIAVLPRLAAALADPIGYDGYWHVFIARNLMREYRSLAHPPLFPLLLRACDAIGHARLAYEAVSLGAGIGVVFLFGRVLQKLRTDAAIPVLGALAMGFAPSAIRMSCAVESYMLCIVFVLAALLPYLDLVRPDPTAVSGPSRAAFAGFLTLALLSHYFAGLFFAACLAAPLLVAAVRPEYRRALVRAFPKRWAADAATVLPPAAVAGLLFSFLARPWVRNIYHLPEFYFQRSGETAASFLFRNLANTFNLFSPVTVASRSAAAALLGLFLVLVFVAAVAGRRLNTGIEGRAMPSAILLFLLVIGMTAGVLGRYPLGGAMRHQLLLFLFGLLAAFVAFDRLLRWATPALRVLLIALCVSGIGANAVWNLREWWQPGPDVFDLEAKMFWSEFPGARAVHVDQFNLIGFFMQHHDWLWTFSGRAVGKPAIERYEISRGERRLTLVAHRDLWNMDFRDPELYKSLEGSRRAADPGCLTVFCVHQILNKPPARKLPNLPANELEDCIPALAREADLAVKKLLVRGDDVFAELCSYHCCPGSR